MKGIAKPTIFFSAYPLKATEQQETSTPNTSPASSSPYLRSLLSATKKTGNEAKVFPMITPYKDPYEGKVSLSPIERIMRKIPVLK